MQDYIVPRSRSGRFIPRLGVIGILVVLLAPSLALAECRLKDGPMTIFRAGTLNKVYALGKENYATAVMLYGACSSLPTGTKLGMVSRGFFTSTVIVKEGHRLGCTGDLENEFIACD